MNEDKTYDFINSSDSSHFGCCEEWEIEADFWYRNDWAGLLCYREKQAAKYPDNHDAQWALGEAYVLNGNYDKALRLLSNLHQKYPDSPSVQHSILDALFATGKNENDFKWIERPRVLRLTENIEEILDRCFEFLKPKRKTCDAEKVYLDALLLSGDYLCFTSKELLEAMKEDSRFIINDPSLPPWDANVRVARKNDKKQAKAKNLSIY